MAISSAPDQLDGTIRDILRAHGHLYVDAGSIREGDDLFRCGMSSHANVSVMLALEEVFAVEFPEHMLRRSTFESVASIREAIAELLAGDQRAN
ncbi:MAG TPA: acyl carrier protein [Acidimicrobiales bacterium]|nr:acyl carrier protein [Acidimicrobiales bacterium]